MLLCKALLTLIFSLDKHMPVMVMVLAVCFVAVIYVYSYVYFLPFYNQFMNKLQGGFAMVFAWAAVCTLVAHIRDRPEHNTESFVFLMSLPFAALVGVAFADWRFQIFDKAVQLSNVYAVELKARRLLKLVNVADLSSKRRFGSSKTTTTAGERDSERQLEVVETVEQLYKEAEDYFPSAMLHLFIAQYLRLYRSNRHLELVHLAEAEAKRPPLDAAFLLFQRRRQIRLDESKNSEASMSVLSRIKFEAARQESEESSLAARELQVEFWHELSNHWPNLTKLTSIGADIENAISSAMAAFQQMRSLNPSSVVVMRSFARFLLEVANFPARAEALVNEADELEERMTREHAESSSTIIFNAKGYELDTSREDVGVVTASAETDRLGEITSITAVAIRAFGYTRRELVGKNLACILPEPLSSSHQIYLETFMRTGVENVVNTTRTVFGRHKRGNIFPMYLNVRPMDDSFGGVMQAVMTRDNFVFFMNKSKRVTAACSESMHMMGVDAPAIEEHGCFIDKYFDDEDLATALEQACEAVKLTRRDASRISLMPRFQTTFAHANTAYVASKSGSDPLNFEGRRASAQVESRRSGSYGVPLSVWVRLQLTNFGPDGTSYSDFGLPHEQDREQSALGLSAAKDPGARTDADNERLVVMTWGLASAEQSNAANKVEANEIETGEAVPCVYAAKADGKVPNPHTAAAADSAPQDAAAAEEAKACPYELMVAASEDDVDSMGCVSEAALSTAAAGQAEELEPVRRRLSVGFSDAVETSEEVVEVPTSAPKKLPKSSKVAPEGGPGERGSVGGSTVRSVASAFHKAISRGAEHEEPSLRRLRLVLYRTSFVVVGMAIAAFLFAQSAFGTVDHDVDLLSLEGDRVMSVQRLTGYVEAMANDGGGSFLSFNESRAQVVLELDVLQHANLELTVHNPPNHEAHTVLMTEENVPVAFLAPELTYRNQSLSTATAEFISAAQLLTVAEEATFMTEHSLEVAFVRNNGMTIANKFVLSRSARNTANHDHLDVLTEATVVAYITLLCLILVCIFGVVLPLTVQVMMESTYRIFSIFMHVPILIIKTLHRRSAQQFEHQRMEVCGDDDFELAGEQETEAGDIDWSKVSFANSKPRPLKKHLGPTVALFLKLAFPLAIAVAYFVVGMTFATSTRSTLSRSEDDLMLTQDRQLLVVQVADSLARAVRSTDADATDLYATQAELSANDLAALHEVLFLGLGDGDSEQAGNKAQRYLFLENGCVTSAGPDCTTYNHGLFLQGLHAALLHYVDRCLALAATSRKSAFATTSVEDRYLLADWVDVDRMSYMVAEGIAHAVDLRADTSTEAAVELTSILELLLIVFVVFMAGCVAFLFRPVLRHLDRTTKRSRSMLLLFPDAVLKGVPAVRDLIIGFSRARAQKK